MNQLYLQISSFYQQMTNVLLIPNFFIKYDFINIDMMWSIFNKSLVKSLKLSKLQLIQNINFSCIIKNLNTDLRYFYSNSMFNKNISKKTSLSAQKKYLNQKYGGRLSQLYKGYEMNHTKLTITEHYNFFLSVFNYKQKIDQNNAIWKLLNQNILQKLEKFNYSEISRIVSYLTLAKINNNLKKHAQSIAYQQICLGSLSDLFGILVNLNLNLQMGFIQQNSQTEDKYDKIYDKIEQILFNTRKKKNIQKTQTIEKAEQTKLLDSNQFPIILIQQGQNKCKHQQGYIQISLNLFYRLCICMSKAKVKRESLFKHFFNNPFVNVYAQQNLAKFDFNQLRNLFINFQRLLYSLKTCKIYNKQYPCLKAIIQQIIKRQANIKEQKNSVQFFISLFMYARFYPQIISSDKMEPHQRKEMQFEHSFKRYLAYYLNNIYQNRQNLSIQPRHLVDFVIMGQIIGIHIQSLLKNVISLVIKQINSLENQNQEANDVEQKEKNFQGKKIIKLFSDSVWTSVWEKYSIFDIQIQENIKIYLTKCEKLHNIRIKIPKIIQLIYRIQQNNTKNRQQKQDKSTKSKDQKKKLFKRNKKSQDEP